MWNSEGTSNSKNVVIHVLINVAFMLIPLIISARRNSVLTLLPTPWIFCLSFSRRVPLFRSRGTEFYVPASSWFFVDLYRRWTAKRRRFQGRLHFWAPPLTEASSRTPRYHPPLKITSHHSSAKRHARSCRSNSTRQIVYIFLKEDPQIIPFRSCTVQLDLSTLCICISCFLSRWRRRRDP